MKMEGGGGAKCSSYLRVLGWAPGEPGRGVREIGLLLGLRFSLYRFGFFTMICIFEAVLSDRGFLSFFLSFFSVPSKSPKKNQKTPFYFTPGGGAVLKSCS